MISNFGITYLTLLFSKDDNTTIEKSILDALNRFNPKRKITRRRDLLPVIIILFIWFYIIFGVLTILNLILQRSPNELYSIDSEEIFSPIGIFLSVMYIFKSIIAYGLWSEKFWAPRLAILDGIIGIWICCFMMLMKYRNSGNIYFIIEIIPLIYYLWVMIKIRKRWEEMK